MRKLFLMGMMVTMAMGGVHAQIAWGAETAGITSHTLTDGSIAADCSGSWSTPTGSSCTFQCSEGDYLYIWGNARRDIGLYRVGVTVTAACGGISVECTCLHTPGPCSCEAYAEDPVVAEKAGEGLCHGQRAAGAWAGTGQYYCASIMPEEATGLEKLEEGFLIKIPAAP